MTNNTKFHEPVLVSEVLNTLKVSENAHLNKQGWYIDATLGTGGHTLALLERGANVIGIEADETILDIARNRIEKAFSATEGGQMRFKLIHGNFRDIAIYVSPLTDIKIRGILVDLGVNSLQLTSDTRGFSFNERLSPLDMRIDPSSQEITAADLLNALRADQLFEMLNKTLSFPIAKRLADQIVSIRSRKRFKTIGDLIDIVDQVKPKGGKIHPATTTLLAIRMAVNSELENLKIALPKMMKILGRSGRLSVISFHSGEDKIVKETFLEFQHFGMGVIVSKKPIIASDTEVIGNPSSRSAKLRCIEKK